MKSSDILRAIRAKHHKAAIVHELVVTDIVYRDAYRSMYAHNRPNLARFVANHWGEVDPYTPEHAAYLEAGKAIRRIDALMMQGEQRTAIEVKVTRADFKRDTPQKRAPWASITHRFVYAVPKGLVTPAEVADGCGLWEVRADGKVEVTKKARINKDAADLPQQIILALAYRAMKNQ